MLTESAGSALQLRKVFKNTLEQISLLLEMSICMLKLFKGYNQAPQYLQISLLTMELIIDLCLWLLTSFRSPNAFHRILCIFCLKVYWLKKSSYC